jgi:cholesterol oxidase
VNASHDEDRALTFLTEDLSSLNASHSPFDVVVIGSGYGAAMATYHLSQCTKDGELLRICVLERGNEYLDGSFPRDVTEMPGHVRTSTANSIEATGNFDALFDVRAGGDVSSLIANGFGGGSLINAGVMIEPLDKVFDDHWPLAYSDLPYQESKMLLGARKLSGEKLPRKYQELKTIAPRTEPAEITIFEDCNHCGNCATGCNFGHKASLDRTLFHRAKEFNRSIRFITGATVEHIKKTEGLWETHIVPTKKNLRKRNADPVITTSTQLILAAGTFGSTELLMKSRQHGLKVSDQLGARFSTNGDMIAVGFDRNTQVNAISRGPAEGNGSRLDVGPTITGVADYRQSDGILLQEMNVPFPIANFFDEIFSTSATVTATTQFDCATHSPSDRHDPFSLNQAALKRTSVYAMMSDDGSAGEIVQNVAKDKSKHKLKKIRCIQKADRFP